MNKVMRFTGINRSVPQQASEDGSCAEIINMRFKKGAWRPIGAKTQLYANTFTYNGSAIAFLAKNMYLHTIEAGQNLNLPNWIGIKDDKVYLIDILLSTCTLIDSGLVNPARVVFLKRTMIIPTDNGLMTYLWSTETTPSQYNKIGSLPVPSVDLVATPFIDPALKIHNATWQASVATAAAHEPATVLGNYYAAINQQSSLGRLYGSIMYMVAFRLFDGTYVMHSVPRYKEISNGGQLHQENPDGSGWNNATWFWSLTMATVSASLDASTFSSYVAMKDLVDSVVVFATKCTPLFKVDDTTVIESLLQTVNPSGEPTYSYREFTATFPLNSPDFEDLAKSSGWYKILEYDFASAITTGGTITKDAETKNFYQDYATRATLTTDEFSHHTLLGKTAYVYNDRVHILNVKTQYAAPLIHWEEYAGYTKLDDIACVLVVHLSTSLGKAVIVSETTLSAYQNDVSSEWFYAQPSIVGYPDSRATKIELALEDSGSYLTIFSLELKKNTGINFAYYHRTTFSVTSTADNNYKPLFIPFASVGAAYTVPAAKTTPYDANRLQVSEIQNPLVYPARNSYQIGNGQGIAIGSGSEEFSAGQWGAFPLIVFCTDGIWALELGDGSVLYSNVLPASGEVADNPLNIIGVGGSVLYSTEKGLFLLSGRQSTKLSEPAEGLPNTAFNSQVEITKLLTDDKFTPTLSGSVSDMDFLTYLDASMIGYDHINKELVVANPTRNYTYIYSLDWKVWYKISVQFTALIDSYPQLYGSSGNFIVNISDDDHAGISEVMIISNPLNLDLPDVFKKIEHMIARCVVSTSTLDYVGFYLFATNDLVNYELITGRQRTGLKLKDLLIQRSAQSAKFYVVVFNGAIDHDSFISHVDISLIPKLNQKIR